MVFTTLLTLYSVTVLCLQSQFHHRNLSLTWNPGCVATASHTLPDHPGSLITLSCSLWASLYIHSFQSVSLLNHACAACLYFLSRSVRHQSFTTVKHKSSTARCVPEGAILALLFFTVFMLVLGQIIHKPGFTVTPSVRNIISRSTRPPTALPSTPLPERFHDGVQQRQDRNFTCWPRSSTEFSVHIDSVATNVLNIAITFQ